METTLKDSIRYIPKDLLNSIEISKEDKDINQIDEIKKKKHGEVRSVLEIPMDKTLEKGIDELLPDDEDNTEK